MVSVWQASPAQKAVFRHRHFAALQPSSLEVWLFNNHLGMALFASQPLSLGFRFLQCPVFFFAIIAALSFGPSFCAYVCTCFL